MKCHVKEIIELYLFVTNWLLIHETRIILLFCMS